MNEVNKFYTLAIIVIILFVLAMLKLTIPVITTLYYGDANSYIYVYKEAYCSKCLPDQKALLEAYKIYISENGTLEAQTLKSIDLVKKRYMLTDRQCPGKFQKGIFNNYVIKSTEPYKLSYNLTNDTINVEVFCPLHKTTISDQININEIRTPPTQSFFKY